MRITKPLVGVLLLLICVACDKSKETPSGMKFKLVKEGTGEPAKAGEVLLFNFTFKDTGDSTYWSTYKAPFPQYMIMRDTTGMKREDGMTQMLRMLRKGDSAVVEIPIKDFYKDYVKRPLPARIDSSWTITTRMKVENIMPQDSFMTYQRDFYENLAKIQAEKDAVILDEYLAKNNIAALKTPTGLRYLITQAGKGENGKSGQYAKVGYAGYTLEGKYFDASDRAIAIEKGFFNPQRDQFAPYAPSDIIIDQSQVISGWHEALKLLNKGAKATIYIPSGLAFGPQRRSDVIKENEIVIFDLEVIDLQDKAPEVQEKKDKRVNDKKVRK